jgi:hypothetical protein
MPMLQLAGRCEPDAGLFIQLLGSGRTHRTFFVKAVAPKNVHGAGDNNRHQEYRGHVPGAVGLAKVSKPVCHFAMPFSLLSWVSRHGERHTSWAHRVRASRVLSEDDQIAPTAVNR